MTTERFRDDLDRIDTGLPDRPDTAAYMREGRVARRRRHGIIGLGAGALVAAAVTPVFVWGGGTATSGHTGDVASDPSSSASSEPTPTPTATPTPAPISMPLPVGPVDRSFGDGMTTAVTEMFPRAEFVEQTVADHWGDTPIEPLLSSPPDWENVFMWNQEYTMEGLQFVYVGLRWDPIPAAQMMWCHSDMYLVEKDCSVTESDASTVVVHDGIRMPGAPVGEWGREVIVAVPSSADDGYLQIQVSAQVEDMTWAEASAALPSAADLIALAQDERLRLPEPTTTPIR